MPLKLPPNVQSSGGQEPDWFTAYAEEMRSMWQWMKLAGASGPGNGFILNQPTLQAGAAFNIGGNGVIGGTLGVTGAAMFGSTISSKKITVTEAGTNNSAQFGNSQSNIDIGGDGNKTFLDTTIWRLELRTAGAARIVLPNAGSVVIGPASLATTATDGFLYIPTCAGAPTGVPTAQTGTVPIVYDTTGTKLWIYRGGAWAGIVI